MGFGNLIRRALGPGHRTPDQRGGRVLRGPTNGNGKRGQRQEPRQLEPDYIEGEYRELPNGNGNGNGGERSYGQGRGRVAGDPKYFDSKRQPTGEFQAGEEDVAGKKRNGKRFARAAGKFVGETFTRGAEAGARAAGKGYRGAKGKYQAHRDEQRRTKAEEDQWWEDRFRAAETGISIPPSKKKDLRKSVRERVDHDFEVRSRAAELGIPEYGHHQKYDRHGRRWVPDLEKGSFQKSISQLQREIQQHESAVRAGRLQEQALERLEKEEFPSPGRRIAKGLGKMGQAAGKLTQADVRPPRQAGQAFRVRGARTPLQDIDSPRYGRGRRGSGMPRVAETLRPGGGRRTGSGMPRISETLRTGRKLPRF